MKKLLAIVISMAMVVAMMPVGVFADAHNEKDENCVASITSSEGTTNYYDSLQEAVNEAADGQEINLLKSCSGEGIATFAGKDTVKNFTINFGGFTYTVTSLKGSASTPNQAFHLEKPSAKASVDNVNVALKNGTIRIEPSIQQSAHILIQNYCNLTLDNMTLNGEDLKLENQINCVVSNNDGNSIINDCKITAPENCTAVDAAIWGNYSGADVSIDNSTVEGDLDIAEYKYNTETKIWERQDKLTQNNGRPCLKIKSGTFTDLDAIDCLEEGAKATIKLGKDATKNVTIPADSTVTIDLNGNKITNDSSHTIVNNGTLTIEDTSENKAGTVDNVTHAKAALVNYGTAVLNGGTYTRSLENAENNKNNAGGNSYYTILNDKGGNMTIRDGVTVTNIGHFSSMIRNGGDEASSAVSKLQINGGNFSGGINTVKNDELGELTITGGSFSNTSQYVIMNWHKANLSGGRFEANESAEAVLFTAKYAENRAVGELAVTGGTYVCKDNQKVICNQYNSGQYTGNANITGGTYSLDPSAYVASGYYAAKNSDGTYTVYRYVPSTTTDNVTNNTTEKNTTADLTPAVSDNKSTTTVDNTTADKIVEKAVENKSTEVIVDAKGNNTVASSEVAIPEKTVKEISEKTDANLVIKTDNGTVDLDKTALAAVAEQAGTTGTVKLVVETVKTDENICHVDLKLITSNGAVKDFKGGNVRVTINLDKELAAKDVVCVYINDNGIYTLVEGVLNADGTYTFVTGHFSEYAVMAKDEADKVIADQLKTMIKDVNLKVRTSKTSKKNIKAVVSGDVKAITDAGYTVKYKFYRSEKKSSKYKAAKVKDTNTYINTTGKKGTKYYYKAKALVYDGDKLVGQTVLTQCKYGVRTWSK